MIYLTTGPAALAMRDQWLPVIQRAVDDADGRWSAEQLLSDVADGRVLVWVVPRGTDIAGVFTTRIVESNVRWVLIEDCAGDDLASWIMPALNAVETWARELGATQIVVEGRRGWERVLRPYGYDSKRIQAVKHLGTIQ